MPFFLLNRSSQKLLDLTLMLQGLTVRVGDQMLAKMHIAASLEKKLQSDYLLVEEDDDEDDDDGGNRDKQISLNAQRQCTESCSVAMRSYPGNDFESRRQNEALLHVEFPVVMKLPIFIKGKVRLQSSELLQKSVYPNSKRIPMWQTGITGVELVVFRIIKFQC
eukprot:Gb_08419 [translate_table: standard]